MNSWLCQQNIWLIYTLRPLWYMIPVQWIIIRYGLRWVSSGPGWECRGGGGAGAPGRAPARPSRPAAGAAPRRRGARPAAAPGPRHTWPRSTQQASAPVREPSTKFSQYFEKVQVKATTSAWTLQNLLKVKDTMIKNVVGKGKFPNFSWAQHVLTPIEHWH